MESTLLTSKPYAFPSKFGQFVAPFTKGNLAKSSMRHLVPTGTFNLNQIQ